MLCFAATQQVRFTRQTRMRLRITERSHTSSKHNMPCCTGNMSYFFSYVILGLSCYIKLSSFIPLHVTFNCRRDSPLWEKTPANQEAGGKYKGPIQYQWMDRGYRWTTHTYSWILLKIGSPGVHFLQTESNEITQCFSESNSHNSIRQNTRFFFWLLM